MATPELAVLRGVFSQQYDSHDGQVPGNVLRKTWLSNMSQAFLDVEYGLGTKKSQSEKNFWRLKIAGILLEKSWKSCQESAYFWKSRPAFASITIPSLTWRQFFDSTSLLGLGPEFVEILLEMTSAAQMFIFKKMKEWIMEGPDCISFSFFLISISISARLQQLLGKDIKNTLERNKSLLEYILKLDTHKHLLLKLKPNEVKCQMSLFARLQSQQSDTRTYLKSHVMEEPNVFYCSKLPHLLSAATIQSVQGNRCESTAQDLLVSIVALKKTCFGNHSTINSPSEVVISDDSVHLARNLLKLMLDRSEDSVIMRVFLKFLDLLDAVEFDGKKEKSSPFPSSDDMDHNDRNLFVITHRLQGYDTAVECLLNEMVAEPARNNSWKEAFACLQSSIECIATKKYIMKILKGIQNCLKFSEIGKNNTQKYLVSALSFQQLFWNSFRLLRLRDKASITESIITERDLSLLLSEYPLKSVESNSQKLQEFTQRKRKKIKLIFDAFMKETDVKDSTVEKFCEALLTAPEVTIQRVVEHILRSQEQAGLMRDLTVKLQCFFDFKTASSQTCLFWESFCKLLSSYWDRNEISAIENGLSFMCDILKGDLMSNNDVDAKLMLEVFGTIIVALQGNEVDSRVQSCKLPFKLAMKTLSRMVTLPVFFKTIPTVQVVSLCVTIAGDIESSIHVWNTNGNFDEEVCEMLRDNLQFLVSKLEEIVDGSLESDQLLLKWVQNVVSSFAWTVQVAFLPLLKNIAGFQLSVPACLSEVCSIPTFFAPCKELSYGTGTGLLAWHQCFVANPSLCPLSSLDLDNLTPEGIRIFTNGWIVTMSQVLPYCLPNQWYTLVEASKILISDFKLHVPVSTKSVMSLPVIDVSEVYSLLGVVQLLSQVFELLSKCCCEHWTSTHMWSYVSKCFCFVMSSLIGNSSEFERACRDAKIFVLSQIFYNVSYLTATLEHLPHDKQSVQANNNLFILLLDVMTSFEKTLDELPNPGTTPADDSSIVFDSSGSDRSSCSERGYERTMLCISDRLQEMSQAVLLIQNEENQKTLNQKLLNLVEGTKV